MSDLVKYQSLRAAGSDAAAAYATLRSDGLGQIEGIRMLREVYELSLLDAKKLAHETDAGEHALESQPGLKKQFTDVLDDFFGDEA